MFLRRWKFHFRGPNTGSPCQRVHQVSSCEWRCVLLQSRLILRLFCIHGANLSGHDGSTCSFHLMLILVQQVDKYGLEEAMGNCKVPPLLLLIKWSLCFDLGHFEAEDKDVTCALKDGVEKAHKAVLAKHGQFALMHMLCFAFLVFNSKSVCNGCGIFPFFGIFLFGALYRHKAYKKHKKKKAIDMGAFVMLKGIVNQKKKQYWQQKAMSSSLCCERITKKILVRNSTDHTTTLAQTPPPSRPRFNSTSFGGPWWWHCPFHPQLLAGISCGW